MIRRFTLQDGRAELFARFVDTPKRRADTTAGAVITPGFGTPAGPGAAIASADDANAANISVIARGDELWALWEAGSPVAVDPKSLETKGVRTLRPDLAHAPFLAHPRFEPDGSLWSLGQVGRQLVVWRVAPDGSLISTTFLDLPRASYIHDFTATERTLVLVLQPWLYGSTSPPVTSALSWRPEEGVEVLVLDKDDLTKRRVYTLPTFFHFHMGSAWTDASGAIRFDICATPDPSFALQGAVDVLKGVYRGEPAARLALVTLHADGRSSLETSDAVAEFPRSDPRRAGHARSRLLHAAVKSKGRPLYQGVGVYDWATNRDDVFDLGPDRLVEEMVFVPRDPGASEMDGWVIGPAVNLAAGATELYVFDSRRIADGPVCTWRADVAIPAGLHGMFIRS
jgi:carotenoid cleavage dioxygenase-like enzyme